MSMCPAMLKVERQTVKIKASGFWRFDMSKEALCMKTVRTKKKSWQSCSKYECKIPY